MRSVFSAGNGSSCALRQVPTAAMSSHGEPERRWISTDFNAPLAVHDDLDLDRAILAVLGGLWRIIAVPAPVGRQALRPVGADISGADVEKRLAFVGTGLGCAQ